MSKKILFTLLLSCIASSCNPKIPKINKIEEEIEEFEENRTPKGINYGPTPGG